MQMDRKMEWRELRTCTCMYISCVHVGTGVSNVSEVILAIIPHWLLVLSLLTHWHTSS